jgi:hypothetical protein
MAVMLGNLYGALREAGVPDDRAQKAAEEAAASTDVIELKKDVAQLKTDAAVLKWMGGLTLALVLAVLGLLLRGAH